MKKDSGQIVQAMPLLEGKVNLTSGVHVVNELIHCVEAGTTLVIWGTGTIGTINMLAGQDYAFEGSINITDGKYHIS